MKPLKERIEEAMRRNPNVSQAEIARACKVKSPSVADWINGKTKSLKPEPARLAAALFGCDQNWIGQGVGLPNWQVRIVQPPIGGPQPEGARTGGGAGSNAERGSTHHRTQNSPLGDDLD